MDKKIFFVILFLCIQLVFCGSFILRLNDNVILEGVSETSEYPTISLKTIWNGNFGYEYNLWFADNFSYRNSIIKVYNQWKFEVLNEISNGWMIGKDGWMFHENDSKLYVLEQQYVSEHEYEQYAQKIAAVQQCLEARGKSFVYVITPVKAAIYPEYLPERYQMVIKEKDGLENVSDYEILLSYFDKYNVNYYDVHNDLTEAKKDIAVYYKTGHHWTVEACSRTLNNVFMYLNEKDNMCLPTIFVKDRDDRLNGKDRDILYTANLIDYTETEIYSYPIFEYSEKTDDKLLLFGTSFGEQIVNTLAGGIDNSVAVESIRYYEYFASQTIVDSEGIWRETYTSDTDIDSYEFLKNIEDSTLVIVEQQGEAGLLDTHKKFIDYLYEKFVLDANQVCNLVLFDDDGGVKYEGFEPVEDWGRWTNSNDAIIRLYIQDSEEKNVLRMKILSMSDDMVYAYINDELIAEVITGRNSIEYVIDIPEGVLQDGINEIRFHSEAELISPSQISDSMDTRKLGIAFEYLSVE